MSNSSGKQGLSVVVWEWKNKQGRWRPYSPEVTQHLERAFGKNLKSVMLGDADPRLRDFCVNLSSLKQTCTTGNFGSVTSVRRTLYPQTSPAGQGAVWEWGGDKVGDWHSYDMCVQCVLEDAWASGVQSIDMNEAFPQCPYVINFCNLIQTNKKTNGCRSIRRKTQAAYPIGRPATPHQNSNQALLHGPSTSGILSKHSSNNQQDNFHESSKGKRRGSKEEVENKSKNEGGARSLLNKVGDLLHLSGGGNSSDGTSSNKTMPIVDIPVTTKNNRPQTRSYNSNISSQINPEKFSRPKPAEPPIRKRPVPKPRTVFPISQSYEKVNDNFPQSMDFQEDKFGSNATLNSDSSTLSTRRPSIETISTYLSQDSFNEDYGAHSMTHSQLLNYNGPKTRNLINLDDSMSEDDVFSADQEVMEVLMNSDQDNTDRPESHFVPISAPSDTVTNTLNGAKRKRTSDKGFKTSFSPPQHPVTNHSSNKNNNNYIFKKRKATTEKEKLLVRHTKAVQASPKDDCSICMCCLAEDSSYNNTSTEFFVGPVVALLKCEHTFHEECLSQLIAASSSNEFIQCPNCKTLHGTKVGNQPHGDMRIQKLRRSLPGHPNCDTIEITYVMHGGIQGSEHPKPNHPYYPVGFPRVAYLPDSEKGRRVLRLLQEAFNRRLTFTIGTSVTTGMEDVVTWNEIHHKTEFYDRSGHGYPDPGYLDNVLEELASHGVVD